MRLLVIMILVSSCAFGQTKISGVVKDINGEAVIGANIMIKDSYDGTSSDTQGKFSFKTDEKGAHLLITTFVGYKTYGQAIVLESKEVVLTIVLQEEANVLDGVTISAGSFTAGEEKRRTVLKPLDIAMTAGATADIAGALNTLPGTQKVGESGRLFVRGGDGNETRTFIDGMVVLDAYGAAAPNTPSRGRFLPFMFKGTSFSTGGYSAEYGQALSSALVLNSKDKAESNQTDIGILSVGADVAHTQVWKHSSLSGKIQYTDIRLYFGLIEQRIDWITPPVALEASTAYRTQVGKEGMLKFFGNVNRSSMKLYNHDILDPTKKQSFDLTNTYQYGNASYLQPLNENWNIRGGLSYTYNENAILLGGKPIGERESGTHTKLVAEYAANENLEWRTGGEVIERNYEAYQLNANTQESQTVSFQEVITAGFTEAQVLLHTKLITKAGGRFEYNSLTHAVSVDPRLSIAYKPGKTGQFAFAYGIFRQSPKNQYVRLNHTLQSEKAEHFIVNYQVITDRKTFRVEAYYKRYNNLVKFVNGNSYNLNNAGNGYARGIELFWRDSETIKNVDYWVSYSYLDTERDYLNYPTTAVPTFASKHNFSVVYKYFISALKTQVGATYSYSSGRPYTNPNNVPFNSDRTPDYHDLSVNLAYLPKPHLIIYFSCTNLLNNDNIFGYQYSDTPANDGFYKSRAIQQTANQFVFLGVFITFSKNKSVNQLPNL